VAQREVVGVRRGALVRHVAVAVDGDRGLDGVAHRDDGVELGRVVVAAVAVHAGVVVHDVLELVFAHLERVELDDVAVRVCRGDGRVAVLGVVGRGDREHERRAHVAIVVVVGNERVVERVPALHAEGGLDEVARGRDAVREHEVGAAVWPGARSERLSSMRGGDISAARASAGTATIANVRTMASQIINEESGRLVFLFYPYCSIRIGSR
jgi:hypothetical protein